MAEITVKTVAGKKAGTVALDEATFAIQPNVPVMHQVVTAQLASRRAGTQSTKTRSRSAAVAPSHIGRRAPDALAGLDELAAVQRRWRRPRARARARITSARRRR